MLVYSIWNNKGGTGKTSLAFQCVTRFAELNPDKKILVIDMCPQANMSELLLGGQESNGSSALLANQAKIPRCSIGGYFDYRLGSPFSVPNFNANDFITTPSVDNDTIPRNLELVCGDPLLELQAIAMNTLANNDIPGINAWIAIIDWLKDLLSKLDHDYVFIDTNPSFSMYTQIALAASDRVILPVMADDSSRRAIQNAFSLIYGLRLPSEVYKNYTFAKKLGDADRSLPKIHLLIKNRITQYMGDASAYKAVLLGMDADLRDLVKQYPTSFTFKDPSRAMASVRDFGTTGVVAFARGCPFSSMPVGKLTVAGRRVQVKKDYRDQALEAIDSVVRKLS
ncbi:ATPase [Pseudoalteromonas sp. GCY]|uniref:ParA family protein n=1 Tax=Pseudoalteromonas sp. GCY TaxID=2003316 RepID=UPI000BFEE325|nr:AAA family ATPase [Pseudoalteromonas sp. GCY]PHI36337.1 ATPase [Pseudoalteromonas sp. GCY]QQQ66900.1 AAA family ATPase [Pseudoalteromonas sp. GCY]